MSEIDDIISGGSGIGVTGGSGGIPSNFKAEEAENDREIEMQWAVTAMDQAEAYWKLITGVRPSTLKRLTKWDDELMDAFAKAFPELQNDEALKVINEDDMKSKVGKERWRNFMTPFEKVIDEYNFGTLLRLNCAEDYTEQNSMFAYRTQFYAIEVARNRRGLNDVAYESAKSA